MRSFKLLQHGGRGASSRLAHQPQDPLFGWLRLWLPSQAGSSVWAAVQRVERDAIWTDPLGSTERTPSSLACLVGLRVQLHDFSFGMAVHFRVFLPLHFRLYFRGTFVGVLMSVLGGSAAMTPNRRSACPGVLTRF